MEHSFNIHTINQKMSYTENSQHIHMDGNKFIITNTTLKVLDCSHAANFSQPDRHQKTNILKILDCSHAANFFQPDKLPYRRQNTIFQVLDCSQAANFSH